MDGRQWPHRTDIFAGTTADADAFVNGGHRGREVIVGIAGHHRDSSRRTMAGTVATFVLTLGRDTLLGNNDGVANLNARLIEGVNGLNSSCGTYFRAACTLRTAPAAVVLHSGLHQAHQVTRGTQHIVGTFRHTELTTRAARCHILCR